MLSYDEKQFFAPAPESSPKPSFFGGAVPRSIPERVEDTSRLLRDTLDRLMRFEGYIKEKYDNLMASMTQDNVTFKQLMEDGCKDFIATVQAEVNLFESNIQATLGLFENATNSQIAEHLERIKAAEMFMRDNLQATLDALLHSMEEEGSLSGVIESDLFKNVKTFGAKGDGATDDTEAIKKAIAALPNGGTVYFPSGVYCVSADIDVTSYITLVGDYRTSIIERLPNALEDYAIFKVTGATGVVFRDLVIQGDKLLHTGSAGEWGMGISFLSAKDCTIDHCIIYDAWGDGVYIGSQSVDEPCSYINILNSSIHSNRRNGVSVINADHLVIDNCGIENNMGTAPEYGVCFECNNAKESVKNAIVSNCRFSDNKYGIGISDSSSVYEVTVDGCVFGSNNGVYVCRTQVDDIGGYFNIQNSIFNSKNGFIFDAKTPAGMPVLIDGCKFFCEAIPIRIGDSNMNLDVVLGGITVNNCSFIRWGNDYYPVMIRSGVHANASYDAISIDGTVLPNTHSMIFASAQTTGNIRLSDRTVPEKNFASDIIMNAAGSIFTHANMNVSSGDKTVMLAETFPYGVDVHFRVTGSNAHKVNFTCENGIFAQVSDSATSVSISGIYSGVTIRHEAPNRWSYRKESNN